MKCDAKHAYGGKMIYEKQWMPIAILICIHNCCVRIGIRGKPLHHKSMQIIEAVNENTLVFNLYAKMATFGTIYSSHSARDTYEVRRKINA
ncbi:hypothetical protein BBBOND_0103550 [Babesia bigemina]|uniref:Uncharacterized protein n=1 Tax=Babesia bigemina TaxID=5866 RepID=A0A061CZI7_BABBI|nr:hypothetical protein BBBOND_0103550 [Babesia bigemina]CDR94041.1 hypothetical protein BBBOND_0103550 [Babesia bigemina]|eukprot:XP_012766227.1 hypothetical protein BBBOND_0103550 [Babesia bigemina]